MRNETDPDLCTSAYDYHLPGEMIAEYPVYPADKAKLLVYERATEKVIHTNFENLPDFIAGGTSLFLNDTRVIKARIFGKKSSGGTIELLLNKPVDNNLFQVMIRGRVHEGTLLSFDEDLEAEVISCLHDGSRLVSFRRGGEILCFENLIDILETIGHVPLPPYIHRCDNSRDSRDYQTLFAKNAGAVAAPTASLHFTTKLLEKIRRKHPIYTLTLHVGAGTFKPVETENILDHPMHSEYFHIPHSTASVLESDQPVLAVGTTVTRTIEYYCRTKKDHGECDLFLHPGNPPRRVNHLLTNFHLPKSTLIMLTAAFAGREKTLELYREAIRKGYRFYSYGDAMLIL